MRKFGFLKFFTLQAVLLLSFSTAQAQTSTAGKIVYADDPGRIQVINADGTGQTELTPGLSIIDDEPVYSPNGSKIAFTRGGNIRGDICVMNADGTNVVTIVPGADFIISRSPSWSPDGTRLVFFSNRRGAGFELWVVNANGSGLVRLTTSIQIGGDSQGPIFSADTDPAWSPDGSKIAFSSNRNGPDNELYVMNADGSNPLILTNDSLDDSMAAWSPDSQKIAFTKSNGGGIHIINRDGTNLVPILAFSSWPAWSPDGLRLAFVQGDPANNFKGNVFIAKTDGTGKIKVTNNPNGARAPSWAPASSPPIPTFTISGLVRTAQGVPISGATLSMFTVSRQTTESNSTGAYSFAGLPAGTYRIDISKPGFGFNPSFVTLTINSNQTTNFTGFVAFTISGKVNGGGSGVPVTLSGAQSRSVFTEHDGVYQFTLVPAGGNYTVSVNTPFFVVTPPSISFNNLQANQVANFNATIAKYKISGTVRRLGIPKPGITMRLRDVTSGNQPLTTVTNATGQYEFANLTAGRSYSVEPSSGLYLSDSKGFAALDGNKIADFDLKSANNLVFNTTAVTIFEGATNLQITVLRGGGGNIGPVTVDYATVDGTAKAGLDYTAVSGTLHFPDGTNSRTITVPILDDQLAEGSEQFSIVLSNATGEVDIVPSLSVAVITIQDIQIQLLTQAGNDRAIALNASTFVVEPFSLTTTEMNFSADQRTRIFLFVQDLRVYQTFPQITVTAVDAKLNQFQLPLEVLAVSSVLPFQQLTVRLPSNLTTGELMVTVTVNGKASNKARITIKP